MDALTDQDWIRDAIMLERGVRLLLDDESTVLDAAGDTLALLGLEADALRGRRLSELAQDASAAQVERALDGLRRGGEAAFDLTPSAGHAHASLRWHALRRGNGTIVATTSAEADGAALDLHGLIESLSMIVLYIDPELRYRFSNAAYERAFGVSKRALAGQRVEDNVDSTTWERVRPLMRRALAGERLRFEQTVRLANGRSVQARTEYVPDFDERGRVRGFYALLDDVTEYTSANELMRAVHRTISRARVDYGTTIEELLRLGCDFLGLETGIVSETRGDEYRVRFIEPARDGLLPGEAFPLGDTYCDITLATGDVLATERAGADPRLRQHPGYLRFGLETYIGVPLVDRGEVFGTLNLSAAAARTQPFSKLELEMVRLLGSAIERLLVQDRFEQGLFQSRLDMEQRALTDSLTGLPNRAHIFSEFEKLREFQLAEGARASVALLDVDHFKRINDTFGHQAGDDVLKRVAETIRRSLRGDDLVGRVGGEEFLVLLPGIASTEAVAVLERVRSAVAALDTRADGEAPVRATVSIGVAECTGELTVDEIYSRADRALYRAKTGGRDRLELAGSDD